MAAYYNELDPFAAQWLRNLISAGHIAPGDVDERSIVDVRPDDLRGYTQCHFFAGIGGWSYALRLAGWRDERPVWTGSCPCQPWSKAGRSEGEASDKHLWPAWFELIRECRPAVVMGEQVPTAAGRGWWDIVAGDLESCDYACAALIAPASSVRAKHKRERLWFVSYAAGERNGLEEVEIPARRDIAEYATRWPSEPALGRVAHGLPDRVGRMRGYGNAIDPRVASELVAAFIERDRVVAA